MDREHVLNSLEAIGAGMSKSTFNRYGVYRLIPRPCVKRLGHGAITKFPQECIFEAAAAHWLLNHTTRREALDNELATPNAVVGPESMFNASIDPETGAPLDLDLDQNASGGLASRTLKPNESIRSYLEKRGGYDRELGQVRLGAVMRAMATGSRTEQERRALSMGLDTAGGYTVPSVLAAQVIDLMRPCLVVGRSGARYLPLEGGEMNFARVVEDPDPKWRAENQPVSEEEIVFGSLKLTPKVIAMIVKCSRELLETSPNIESLLETTLARVMAGKIDRACLVGGDGAIEPTGVSNWPGIHTLEHNNPINYDAILQARTKLLMSNSDEPRAAILSARDEGVLSLLKDGEGKPALVPPVIAKLPILATTAIPIDGEDKSICVLGDFRQMIIAQKIGLRIEVLKERYADYMKVAFLVYAMLDMAIEQAEAFCKITGLVEPA
ncbi:MAG: phage major capsid protein [Bacillota bacterium]|nr:phage major capsid protein [Bacillota bacterium]